MDKEWMFILLHLLALYVAASPVDKIKEDYHTLRADQKLLSGFTLAQGSVKEQDIGARNSPQGPTIQKGKLNVTHELSNHDNTTAQNDTAHDRNKRSPAYSRSYNVKNRMYASPTGKSYRPSSYGYGGGPSGPYAGARAGRTAGRYSAEPMYGSPAGYSPVGGRGGGGYSVGGGYGGGGYPAPAMAPTYGGGYPGGGYAPAAAAPAAGGAAGAAAGAPGSEWAIDEKALAKYIDQLTKGSKSSRRRRKGSGSDSHGSKHARRRRKSKRGDEKAKASSRRRRKEKEAKKGSRRRKEKTSRRSSKRRKSSSSSSSSKSSQQYYDDFSGASYDEEPYAKPKARRARDPDQVKPLDMSEVYTPKPAYSEPLSYSPQKQAQSDLLLSSLFSSLLQSAATKPQPQPQPQLQPQPQTPAPKPQQQNVASELAKLGQLIQTTFRKMTSRLDGMKMAKEMRQKKYITPAPIDDDNFINSRSTSQWNNVVNRYQRG